MASPYSAMHVGTSKSLDHTSAELICMSPQQADVLAAIIGERNYQNQKRGTLEKRGHEVGAWITIMQTLLNDAAKAWSSSNGDHGALDELRKVAAVALACFEQHGVPSRSIPGLVDHAGAISALKTPPDVLAALSAAANIPQSERDELSDPHAWLASQKPVGQAFTSTITLPEASPETKGQCNDERACGACFSDQGECENAADVTEAKLTAIARKFIDDNHVSCPEATIKDSVYEHAPALVEQLADVVGYFKHPDED